MDPFADLGPVVPAMPPQEFLDLSAEQNIAFDPGDLERLGTFVALLLAANERVNLTAIREAERVWVRHILDSLTLMAFLAELDEGAARVIDVGSGGGLPALPLAIAMGSLDFTLLEATGKKAAFLRLAIERLSLPNARVVCGRAEQIGQQREQRERYDAAMARALGPTRVAAELTIPLIHPGGVVLLIKGERAEQELIDAKHALRTLHATHERTHITPSGRVVVLTKRGATPRLYPRRDGEPKRNPL